MALRELDEPVARSFVFTLEAAISNPRADLRLAVATATFRAGGLMRRRGVIAAQCSLRLRVERRRNGRGVEETPHPLRVPTTFTRRACSVKRV
jgi:hypothetical protein